LDDFADFLLRDAQYVGDLAGPQSLVKERVRSSPVPRRETRARSAGASSCVSPALGGLAPDQHVTCTSGTAISPGGLRFSKLTSILCGEWQTHRQRSRILQRLRGRNLGGTALHVHRYAPKADPGAPPSRNNLVEHLIGSPLAYAEVCADVADPEGANSGA
jgi:hypothetical protein